MRIFSTLAMMAFLLSPVWASENIYVSRVDGPQFLQQCEQLVRPAGGTPWIVAQEPGAPSQPFVLKRESDDEKETWLVFKDLVINHGVVELKFRVPPEDSKAKLGVVWRWKNEKNHSGVEFDFKAKTASLYQTRDGIRDELKETDLRLKAIDWHSVRVDFQGNWAVVALDGQHILEMEDSRLFGEGGVGLWAGKRSHPSFDDFRIARK